MKKLFAFIALTLLSTALFAQFRTASGYEDLYDSETVRSLKEHVRTLSSAEMEGRGAGSEGERLAARYIGNVLSDYGIDVLTPPSGSDFGIASADGDTLFSRNVLGFLQGWDKSMNGRYIVIGARMDNLGTDTYMLDGEPVRRTYYGANGNASGVAMMLELASKLSTNRPLLHRSVLFVAFGASTQTFAGSWYFLNRSFGDVDRIDAMVDLDMLGTGSSGFYAYTSANDDLDRIVRSLRGELLPIEAELATEEPYPSDNKAFYDKEIPSVLFTTGRYPEHDTSRDTFDIVDFETMEKELEYIYSYVMLLTEGQRPAFRTESVSGKVREAGVVSFSDVDVKPMFLNSADPRTFLEKWVYQYVKYPKYAVENGIQGRVMVDFVIDEKGNVTDVKVSRGIHASLDEEAVRVISASPKWRPGRHRGKKGKTALTVAVEFRLQKKSDGSFGINGIKIN